MLQQLFGFGRRSVLVVSQLSATGAELDGPILLARPLGLPHLARELLDLGPHRLGGGYPRAPRRVGFEHGVHLGRLHAAPGQRGLHTVGIGTQCPDIDHSCSK